MWQWIRCLLIVCVLFPTLAHAQDASDILVTIQDVSGQGVANVQLIVRDSSGQVDLARVQTNEVGVAAVDGVVVSDVRIMVVGVLATGQSLILRGDDALGIRVFLDAGTTTVQLRVEVDGTVIPDPATEIVQEITQVEVATTLFIPTLVPQVAQVVVASPLAVPGVVPEGTTPTPIMSIPLWPIIVIVLFLVVIVFVMMRGQHI